MVKPITNELLNQITTRLIEALKPEKIILFGSYAYGVPTEDSDLDLLVVVAESDEPRYKRARKAYKALRRIGLPKDILVMTRAEVEQKSNVLSSLVWQALRNGKILYE